MIEHLSGALAALSTALSIGKSFTDVRDTANAQERLIEFNAAIIAAQSDIVAAQAAQARLSEQVNALEKECVRLQDWRAERENYALQQVGAGVFVYTPNDAMTALEATQKFCCHCFDNQQIKATLQQKTEPGFNVGLICPNGCPKLVFTHYLDSA